jgi:DNA helicase II / ATP-dependent DNA helicase PcrA
MTRFTPQQQTVIDAIASGRSIAARAVAGSGKTTTLIAGLAHAKSPGLALAFNKRNAEDLKAKLPAGSPVEAKTLNALGHRIWSDHIRKRLTVSATKTGDLIKSLGITTDDRDEWTALVRMISVAKSRAIEPGVLGRPEPDMAEWLAGAQQIDIPDDLFEHLAKHAKRILAESCKQAWAGTIDFDDQLYMPVIFNARFPAPHLVAVDEVQDLSPLQHEMVARLKPKQLIVVGDPAQAIYGFRGASESSYHDLIERFELPECPLTVSFRCPEVVGAEARFYVPDFTCVAGAAPGRLARITQADLAPGAIICRYNAPLIRLAFQAIRIGQPIQFLGRDFIAGLKAVLKRAPTPDKLAEWLQTRLREARTQGAKNRAQDQHDSLLVVLEGAKATGRDPADILTRLSDPTASRVVLSTVHKAKGLEWNQVTFLGYNKHVEGGQESNINYVGVTRAQETLLIVEDRR